MSFDTADSLELLNDKLYLCFAHDMFGNLAEILGRILKHFIRLRGGDLRFQSQALRIFMADKLLSLDRLLRSLTTISLSRAFGFISLGLIEVLDLFKISFILWFLLKFLRFLERINLLMMIS